MTLVFCPNDCGYFADFCPKDLGYSHAHPALVRTPDSATPKTCSPDTCTGGRTGLRSPGMSALSPARPAGPAASRGSCSDACSPWASTSGSKPPWRPSPLGRDHVGAMARRRDPTPRRCAGSRDQVFSDLVLGNGRWTHSPRCIRQDTTSLRSPGRPDIPRQAGKTKVR